MLRPSPPKLAIPVTTAGSPSASSANGQTGRPSMWSKSAQRKMTRLYLYTTLPLTKIVELIHSNASESAAPGHESAHKKLNTLLDKEPRWLHPRNETDMDRRVSELANSPTRIQSAANAVVGHSRTTSNTSRMSLSPQPVRVEDSVSPAHLSELPLVYDLAMTSASPQQAISSTGLPASSSAAVSPADPTQAEQMDDQILFSNFLRRTTCLSNSTSQTTGSFHRVLSDYPESYVRTVKRLVKRFTAPIASQFDLSPSLSDGNSAVESWVNSEDCPQKLIDGPFPMPGDFLRLDDYSGAQCNSTHGAQSSSHCLCFMALDACVLPWVNQMGLTESGLRVLNNGPTQKDAGLKDSFGNTVLHFLAARGCISTISHSLNIDYCKSLIEAKNSAGQTFLHVLNRRILENPEYVYNLLTMVSSRSHDMIRARDVYGRSFFHVLQAKNCPGEVIERVASLCKGDYRDAFGVTHWRDDTAMDLDQPHLALQNPFSPISTSDPRVARESRLLENVRNASKYPWLQDEDGRNGLHCLALATLSFATIVNKYQLQPSRDRVTKKQQTPKNAQDSSTDKLNLRLSLLMGLLQAGVDPNQHDKDGNTPLMVFVAELPEDDDYKIPPKILEALIRKGANVNARNRRGETALHIAVRCGRKLAMRTLCQFEANVHARDSAGRSLLDVADVKVRMMNCGTDEHVRNYAHYEACRAWLSGKGMALQNPSIIDEWGGSTVT
ncbi:hypothetical protein QQS21_007207 [Conoideocrella luteorostrata]|uniref:Ankyrin n=1 Tax=Conoideocrella luteorostrata TaxID=1105319 RepID=A0AAJ0FSA0_9HYPO|nr:hypothetical protein QQS21_007207 [Conoideocrella luteorostrata]